jgi:hypothetical protein
MIVLPRKTKEDLMKTNLDSLFKTNSNLEKDGVWFDVSIGVSFLLRRFGGANGNKVAQSMAKYHKPYAKLIEAKKLSDEETTEIMAKVFVDSCLVDWKGVTDEDGKEIVCNMENAVNLFKNLPELFNTLFQYCQGVESFREDLGNS